MLNTIIERKKIEVAELKARETIESLIVKIDGTTTRDFKTAISRPGKVNVIAEVKKASPSRGIIVNDFDPVRIALDYTSLGAAALSVLTDEQFFQGHKDYLTRIKQISPLPLLRKDFIIDELQIYEARAIGADAVLLIAAILTPEQLRTFQKTAHDLTMSALVEVHNEQELEQALAAGASIIGINNRDLKDFTMDLTTTPRLMKMIPEGKVIVSESGIKTRGDITQGVNAVLIGEGLVNNIDLLQ